LAKIDENFDQAMMQNVLVLHALDVLEPANDQRTCWICCYIIINNSLDFLGLYVNHFFPGFIP